MKIKIEPKIKTMSDLRRFLARILSQIPGDMKVTKFDFSVTIKKGD